MELVGQKIAKQSMPKTNIVVIRDKRGRCLGGRPVPVYPARQIADAGSYIKSPPPQTIT
jgi:hypothetical protein